MHNWFYILVRTFPFWAIPIGFAVLATAFGKKGKKWLLVPGIALIAGGVAFLFAQGHFTAVPFVHEMLNSEQPRGDDEGLR